jgi:hypothetical protein
MYVRHRVEHLIDIGMQEKVQSNKDLDLPTQQELLAQFRCDEISAQALAEFNEQSKSQRKPVESGRVVEDLGKMMQGWWTTALGNFFPPSILSRH